MYQNTCPNFSSCQIIIKDELVPNLIIKQQYIDTFCKGNNAGWVKCSRYQTKIKLNFCPDFVLPDSNLTIDEILDKFEEQLTE